MMINRGSWRGTRVMSPLTMQAMTAEYPASSGIRGLVGQANRLFVESF
ncbi:MAG: hypothetical protein R3C28_10610 [Pirellulaceae bacterium]